MYRSPSETMRLKGGQEIEAYIPSWAEEKGVGVWGFKGEEDKSQEAKSGCLVIRYLPHHEGKSFR